MSRNYLLLQLFLILQISYSNGFYTITAPGIINSNRKYTVCVSLHNVSESVTLRVGIQSEHSWSAVQEVTLQPFEIKMLDFYPPKLETIKTYELFAEGIKGLQFRNSSSIYALEDTGANIYIETDKGTYKPGDLLRFRVIILDEHTRPMKIIEPIKVQIFDNATNRVKQFKDIRLNKGFYADEFQISKEPILGNWTLKVSIGGKYALEKIAPFEVDKYVLPKFKVHIKTDRYFVIEDRIMKIEIFGKYTYNKFVEGIVELEIGVKSNRGPRWKQLPNQTANIVELMARFEFDLYTLLDSEQQSAGGTLCLRAHLKEKGTDIVQKATADIELKIQKYKITIPLDEIQFRNKIPYSMRAKVQHWNGTIVNDPLTLMYMKHARNTYSSKLDTNGAAYFEFDYSPHNVIEFIYKDSSARQYGLYLAVDEDVNFFRRPDTKITSANCRLSLKRKRPDLNSVLEVIVESNREIPYLVYTVTSHANIIKSERLQLDSKQNIYTIKITPSIEMVPVSFLYVHYVVNGNLTFCEMKIELPEEFENQLSISAPQNVKSGEGITMKINAQPNSRVLIAAVDLSSVLLNPGNRLSKRNILDDMIKDRSYAFAYPGTISGLKTLTNAHYDHNPFIQFPEYITPNVEYKIVNVEDGMIGFGEEEDVRSNFPETWIFQDFEATDAVTTIDFKLPDTITTWIVTAVSLNEKTGVGIIDPALEITAFKKFFISTNLPYSIKLGEIVSIPTMIFNYHGESLSTEVEMKNSLKEFKFVDENSNMTTNLGIVKRNIIVPANSAKAVNFLIHPQKLGDINIHITAKTNLFSDSILQKLAVQPDGETIFNNHEVYLTLRPGENSTANFKANIPLNVIPECTILQLSISGNVLLPSLENLDDLVDKPTGCGEQNMIHFAPDILVLEYLSATHQTSKYANLVATAIKYVEIGYQQQLRFRHEDGGYSVFGTGRPSNWLTAYVIRFFIKGLNYVPIESHIIESGLDFLSTQQSSNGEFVDAGYLFNPAHQNRYGFTAFVLLSFMESRKYARKYKEVIQKGLDFLASNSNDVDDIYSLAIMATAFTMAKHEHAPVILNKLLPLAKKENDLQWWTDNTNGRMTDIESTSYILLALLHVPGHYLPIAKWLLEQRNSHGGFKSTQDTVVGLQAMIKFAQSYKQPNDTLIKVSYRALDIQKKEIESSIMGLDPENYMILQREELPSLTRSVEIFVLGTGNVFLQFSYQYNQNENPVPEYLHLVSQHRYILPKSFIIETEIESSIDDPTLKMDVCFKYQPLDDAKNAATNMIIVEINLPSGYFMSSENLKKLEIVDVVERVEYKKLNEVILYFAFLKPNKEVCVNVVVDKKNDVRNLKPSMIAIYDYYHSDRREVATYEIVKN